MLLLMTMPYLAARVASSIAGREYDTRTAGAVGLALLFIFTGIGHFIQTEPMTRMLPPWVPARRGLVYVTGMLEFAAAAGFLIPKYRRPAGWVAAVMLVSFFPANIYAAFNHAPMGGHAWGPIYLLIRAPLQVAVLLWVFWFTLRPDESSSFASRAQPAGSGYLFQ
jgi:uncharacterized membrane protein